MVLNFQEGVHNTGISNCNFPATMRRVHLQWSFNLETQSYGRFWDFFLFFFFFSLCQKYWNSKLETQGITCKCSLPLFLCSSLWHRNMLLHLRKVFAPNIRWRKDPLLVQHSPATCLCVLRILETILSPLWLGLHSMLQIRNLQWFNLELQEAISWTDDPGCLWNLGC